MQFSIVMHQSQTCIAPLISNAQVLVHKHRDRQIAKGQKPEELRLNDDMLQIMLKEISSDGIYADDTE